MSVVMNMLRVSFARGFWGLHFGHLYNTPNQMKYARVLVPIRFARNVVNIILVLVVFSACGKIFTNQSMPVLTAIRYMAAWERVDFSAHHK